MAKSAHLSRREQTMFLKRALLSAGAVLGIACITTFVKAQLTSQSWPEFTIVRTESSTTSRTGRTEMVKFEAQRHDGSRATGDFTAIGDPRHFGTRDIFLRPEGKNVHVDDVVRMRTTTFFTSSAGKPPVADPLCGVSTIPPSFKPLYKGLDTVLGFKTVLIQTEEGPYSDTNWKVPDLGCAVVKMTEDRRDERGIVTGHFELEASKIIVGAPDPKLFEIPVDYPEKSPSERVQARRQGRPISDKGLKALQEQDRRYFENHRSTGH